ncbi:MAG: hypothetical protein K5799_09830 [Erythrobacter sp.]|nr:hypothetical protein [Erythrobacter sp.]
MAIVLAITLLVPVFFEWLRKRRNLRRLDPEAVDQLLLTDRSQCQISVR